MKVVLFTLLVCVGVAASLDCFVCNSAVDSSCEDDFNVESQALLTAFNTTCVEDPEEPVFCRKVKMYLERTGEVRVQRECAYKRRENKTCYQQRAEDHVTVTCQCDEYLCNGAPINSHTAFTAVIVALVATVAARG